MVGLYLVVEPALVGSVTNEATPSYIYIYHLSKGTTPDLCLNHFFFTLEFFLQVFRSKIVKLTQNYHCKFFAIAGCSQDIKKCQPYAKDMPKILQQYGKGMPVICKINANDMPQINKIYALYLHKQNKEFLIRKIIYLSLTIQLLFS